MAILALQDDCIGKSHVFTLLHVHPIPGIFSNLQLQVCCSCGLAVSILASASAAMSKKAYKSQASSARAASGAFGGAFGSDSNVFGGVPSSSLSYVYEPPDLSGLSDLNVSVAFKNLQKKDSTTKSKALEELQNYTGALGKDGVEETVLEAWVRFPRSFSVAVIVMNLLLLRSRSIPAPP